jgi:hypothetical protein
MKFSQNGGKAEHHSAATFEDLEFLVQIEVQFADLRRVPPDTLGGEDGIDRDLTAGMAEHCPQVCGC